MLVSGERLRIFRACRPDRRRCALPAGIANLKHGYWQMKRHRVGPARQGKKLSPGVIAPPNHRRGHSIWLRLPRTPLCRAANEGAPAFFIMPEKDHSSDGQRICNRGDEKSSMFPCVLGFSAAGLFVAGQNSAPLRLNALVTAIISSSAAAGWYAWRSDAELANPLHESVRSEHSFQQTIWFYME